MITLLGIGLMLAMVALFGMVLLAEEGIEDETGYHKKG